MHYRKYLSIARNGFKEATAFRLDALTIFASSVVFLVLYYAVWSAIDQSGQIQGGLQQVITYLVAGQIVSNAVTLNAENYIGQRIRRGTIVNELKRPIDLMAQVYFNQLGWAIFDTVAKAVPITIVGVLAFGVQIPMDITLLAFAFGVFLAFNLVFLASYIAAMFVFWTKVDWSVRMTRSTVQGLFSGVMFPLYLLPSNLETIFNLLPFRAMADSPIRIFTGQTSGMEIMTTFGIQLFWTVVLFVVAILFWRKAKSKLTVQGG